MIGARMLQAAAGVGGCDEFTSLMVHSNTSNGSTTFADSSQNAHTLTPSGNAQHSTAQKQFGASSILFDGNGDYLTIPQDATFDFGTGDFTIDFWVRRIADAKPVSPRLAQNMLIGQTNASTVASWTILAGNSTSDTFQFGDRAFVGILASTTTIVNNTWYHLAIVRNSGTSTLYLDGVPEDSVADSTNYASAHDVTVGLIQYLQADDRDFEGYIDELRISKGVARWTADFSGSLPSAPYC